MNCELFSPFSLRLPDGHLWQCRRPQVMGILNVTDDSFYAASQCPDAGAVERRVRQMVFEGVDIIDVGGCSTRPGSIPPSGEVELQRVALGIDAVRRLAPEDTLISVDTFRPSVARRAIADMGAHIINDVRGTNPEPGMYDTVAELHAPYILMHSRGTSATMQQQCLYGDVVADVAGELDRCVQDLTARGVADIIVDPGLGFAKTAEQCYRLLDNLSVMASMLRRPMLVGLSRKSMLYRPLGLGPDDVLPATTALHALALLQGTSILRVHDVAAARQCVSVIQNSQCSIHNADKGRNVNCELRIKENA